MKRSVRYIHDIRIDVFDYFTVAFNLKFIWTVIEINGNLAKLGLSST